MATLKIEDTRVNSRQIIPRFSGKNKVNFVT